MNSIKLSDRLNYTPPIEPFHMVAHSEESARCASILLIKVPFDAHKPLTCRSFLQAFAVHHCREESVFLASKTESDGQFLLLVMSTQSLLYSLLDHLEKM